MGILRSDRVSGLGGANAINGSVFFGGDQHLRVAASSDFNLADNDFTLECWINFSGFDGTGFDTITWSGDIGTAASRSFQWDYKNSSNELRLVISVSDSGTTYASSWTASKDTWYHIAACRSGADLKLFVDGTQIGSTHNIGSNVIDYDNVPYGIGQRRGNLDRGVIGYISNYRLINGTALYTSNFTAPAQRLTNIDNTVLLCCQSPGNALKEETGKTIQSVVDNTNNAPPAASHFAPDKGEDHGTTFTDNTKFDTLSYMVPPGGTTTQSNRGRAVFGLGNAPNSVNNIEYVQIQSEGNAVDFGDLITAQTAGGAGSSSTRGIFGGGQAPSKTNVISYVTIATTSNVTDFGDLSVVRDFVGGLSNSTRGLFLGGRIEPASANSDTVDYVTIASTGNAADFGNLQSIRHGGAGCASATRGLFGGGSPPNGGMNTIDYVTIASAGNGTDYGDLSVARVQPASLSSSTRGIWSGGTTPSHSDVIDYVTIASTGNATDFGNLTVARRGHAAATNSLRGIFNSGEGSPALVNTIDYVTIATTGDAKDFGDCTLARLNSAGCSDSHGGIS